MPLDRPAAADDAASFQEEGGAAVKALVRPIAVAFGLANLYLLIFTGPLVSQTHQLIYQLTGAASVIFVPVIIYLLALSAALAVLLAIAERRAGRFRDLIWAAALLLLPSTLLIALASFFEFDVPHWLRFVVWILSLACFAAIAVFRRRWQHGLEVMREFSASVLGVFALCGIAVMAELLWFGWQSRDLNPPFVAHRAQAAAVVPHQRIIWVVLDELSYEQVYGGRFPGLELPAFDQLASESVVFTHVKPAGDFTRQVLPSLMTGDGVDELRVSAAGDLEALHDPSTGKWRKFDQHKTVFQDARDNGYSTGIAGWYNPYCRILPAVLDHCYWTYGQDTPARLSPDASAESNLWEPFQLLAGELKHRFGEGPGPLTEEQLDIKMHSSDYSHLLAAGDAFVEDPSIDFLLLHMPVPHPLGFYDRRDQRIAQKHTSYIDNLALADRYLGHLRAMMERQGQWDSTTIVVMGDHSWRTKLIWERSAGWSAEDRAASHGGQFDDRPAYIVKLPNEHAGARIDGPFAAIHTRAMFDAMLQGRLKTLAELEAWVAGQH